MTLNRLYPHLPISSRVLWNIPFRVLQRNVQQKVCENEAHTKYDIVVIGGGIVGAASARELLIRHPNIKIAIVEKENQFAFHQSGHNSGVIHAGIYYKPGSLKAKLCVKGMNLAYRYLDKKQIPYKKCGKLIVATTKMEVSRLADLYDRGMANGVKDMKIISGEEIAEYEPYCRGLQALWSPHTGIVDWGMVTGQYVKDFVQQGGNSYLNYEVTACVEGNDPDYPVIISGKEQKGAVKNIKAKYVLTCCGLHSDTISVMTGCPEEPKIIPFRGDYLLLTPESNFLVKGNIYPVPDPRFPFLGVHFTQRMDGRVILGPNAVLAFAKEGYKFKNVNLKELKDIVLYPGFRKMASKYLGFGLKETIKSLILPMQIYSLQKYIPVLSELNIEWGPAGVRAQAMAKDGTLVDDFVFDSSLGQGAIGSRVLHCRNAPSPGATSSLAIAEMIADKMKEQFNL